MKVYDWTKMQHTNRCGVMAMTSKEMSKDSYLQSFDVQ